MVVGPFQPLVSRRIDRGHVSGQLQGHTKHVGIELQMLLGLGQRLLGSLDLLLHSGALLPEGLRRHLVALFSVQPDKAALFGRQFLDELGLDLPDLADGLLADGDKALYRLGALLNVGGTQLHGVLSVVALYGCLDQLGAHIGALVAGRAVDARAAKEVWIVMAALAGGDTEAQALTAVAAEDAALEVVAMNLWPLTGDALFIEPRLHAVEGVLVDQRIVATAKDLLVRGAALVDDPAGVERVAQHPVPCGDADLARRVALGGTAAQAKPIQLRGELGDRVLAAVVELEGVGDEVMALWVELDATNLPTVGQLLDRSDVAEPKATVRAAGLGLLEQAAPHVAACLHRLVLVVEGEHALHEERLRRVNFTF